MEVISPLPRPPSACGLDFPELCSLVRRLLRSIQAMTPTAMMRSAPTPQPTPIPMEAPFERPEPVSSEAVCAGADADVFDDATEEDPLVVMAEVAEVGVEVGAEDALGVTVGDVAVGVLPETHEMVELTAKGRAARFWRVALLVKSGCLPLQLHCLLGFWTSVAPLVSLQFVQVPACVSHWTRPDHC